ncbi:hydroperoxide isomerase ALOXE3-like [Betta splendens]|uniref:Hydroperoxide isomerase ALOXE3-like n=1 Tax=Betta splendens TaxID=158456 RepID=A0A9W2XR07_BETSP|nr:hydroperoxide isomerase ALOXE3-like [Betta splendens]
MVDYEVTVSTDNRLQATTLNNIYLKLVGTDGESQRKWLMGLKGATAFIRGASWTNSAWYFYYKDDGLRLWEIIHRFVERVLGHYYKSDTDVQKDSELQKWIWDIFEHGFLSQASTGIPQGFSTMTELNKFVTMVIFTGSCQHAAVNSGQYDYGGWMLNTPSTLQLPPPTRKGTTSEETMLQTFPDVNTTVQGMSTMWLLSKQSSDFVPFGEYPEEHFTEEIPCELIKDFQAELKKLSSDIKARNSTLKLPYLYLDPTALENSVAI